MPHLVKKARESTAGNNVKSGTVTVGTTATAFTETADCYIIVFEADSGNTDSVYLGDSNVSTTENRITLNASELISLSLRDMTKLYHISGTVAQSVHYLAITDDEE